MKKYDKVSYLINNVGVEGHHREVIDDHSSVEVERFAIGHESWSHV